MGSPEPLGAGPGHAGLAAGRLAVPGWGAPGGPCFAPAARAPSPRDAPAPGVGRQRAPRPPGAQFLFRTSPRPASGRARAPWPVRGARAPRGRREPVSDAIFLSPPPSFFFFSFFGGRAVAALGWQPCVRVRCPEDLGVRPRREEKGDRAPGPLGAAQTGRPIAQMRRLRPPGAADAKIAHRGTGAPPHLGQRGGCFEAGVPRRCQQVSNPVGTGKYGATGLSTFQRAPRAAAGRSPAGLGLGGGAAGSGARVTAGSGGLTSRPAVAVAAGGDGGGVHSAPAARRIVCGEGPACARVSTAGPAPARPQGRLPARLQDLAGSKRQTELLGGDLVTRLVPLPPALYKFVVRSAELSG